MVEFTPFSAHAPGLIVALLRRSYAAFFAELPHCYDEWLPGWRAYDAAVFAQPETVGACGFVTCVDDLPVGFASWNPREFPAVGIIGHNCIVPEQQGQGIGGQQITEILRRFRASGVRRARVTTGTHSFFVPAQRMYIARGFGEVRRRMVDAPVPYEVIDYELALIPTEFFDNKESGE